MIKSCRLQARGRYELRSCSYRDDATNGCNGTDLELVSNRTAWVRGETSRVKGKGLDKSNSTRAILSSIGSVGDRLLLFRASRDSFLSLVRGSRLQRRSFSIFLTGLETVIGISLVLERLQAPSSSPVQLADGTRVDSTQSSTPARRHPGPCPIIRQSFNLSDRQSA